MKLKQVEEAKSELANKVAEAKVKVDDAKQHIENKVAEAKLNVDEVKKNGTY